MKRLTKSQRRLLTTSVHVYNQGYDDGYLAALEDIREAVGENTDRRRAQDAKRTNST